MNLLKRFLKHQAGVTAIEYSLIAAGIAIVIVAAVTAAGTAVQGTFNNVAALLAP